MCRVQAAAVAFAAAAIGLARNARASSAAFELDYSVPVGCPSEAAFVADVRERIADRKIADTDGRLVRIRVVEGRGTYRGALETFDPPSVREVGGETCEEVARALVVFVALAVSPPDSDTPESVSPLDSDPAESVSPPVPREKYAPARPSAPRTATSDGRTRLWPRFGVDLRALAATGVAPGLSPGGAGAARLVLATRPSFRWIVHAGALVTYREEPIFDGAFTFLWSAARVDAGPSVDLGRFRVSGGPAVRAGVLAVRARDLPSAASYSAFWGDVGAFARLDRPLSPALALSFMVELAAPLQRKSFGIQGVQTPVHEIPPVFGTVSFGMTLGQ